MLNIDEVIELKKIIKEKFNQNLHVHDTCGGAYFSFDVKIKGIKKFMDEYFSKKGLKAEFDKDLLSFTVKRI